MTLNLIPIIHSAEEKKARNLKYKQNFIQRHFGGDVEEYKKFMREKVSSLYHDTTKSYHEASNKKRSELYFKRKAERQILEEETK